jgi:glyoxylase-like metal-dependent hydrolase (beta-lactamase superfamily II)
MIIDSIKLYECGYCTHPEKIVLPNGTLKSIEFPATVALIKHPIKGYILFDTGYGRHFIEATKKFPYSLYAKLTPVFFTEEKSIKKQLEIDGIKAGDINTIILSHFHGDHTGGLKDFPDAKILTFRKGYEPIKSMSKLRALTKGCLLDLIPEDIDTRITFIDQAEIKLDNGYGEFTTGFDVFGDKSIIAVDLTGHAIGQFGIFVNLQSGKRVLLCADAVWLSQAYEKLIFPHKVANLLIEDIKAYKKNVIKIHHLSRTNSEIDILPTHCQKTWELVKKGFVYE